MLYLHATLIFRNPFSLIELFNLIYPPHLFWESRRDAYKMMKMECKYFIRMAFYKKRNPMRGSNLGGGGVIWGILGQLINLVEYRNRDLYRTEIQSK